MRHWHSVVVDQEPPEKDKAGQQRDQEHGQADDVVSTNIFHLSVPLFLGFELIGSSVSKAVRNFGAKNHGASQRQLSAILSRKRAK